VLARRLPGGVAVGASVYAAGLGAVDGVDLLYAGSDRVEQSGRLVDVRLGGTKDWAGDRSLEVVLLHSRFDMTHDVHFTNTRWDPVARVATTTQRSDHNLDHTHIWGAHAEYTRPLGTEGWRLGWLATANRLGHPKIPNYQIMNIPRDPGTTYAFDAGVGIARSVGGTTFGIDVIHEPMYSTTWADAARDTAIVHGGVIPAGGKTVENDFRFSNTKLRLGLGRESRIGGDSGATLGFQLGLGVYAIDYRLHQTNNVQQDTRDQHEHWMEWTPTFALRYRSRDLGLAYTFHATCGPSSCFRTMVSDDVRVTAPPGAGGIIAAPSAPLTLDGGSVMLHRFTFSVPIR
jgi:hypothetical protein